MAGDCEKRAKRKTVFVLTSAQLQARMDPISTLKAKGIEEDKVVEYQAAFQMFDVYNRGFFDENDLKELLSRFSTCSVCVCGALACCPCRALWQCMYLYVR